MDVAGFIAQINALLPSVEQFIARRRSDNSIMTVEDAKEEIEFHTIVYNEERLPAGNIIEDLIVNTNFSMGNFGPYEFNSEIEYIDDYEGFATYNDHFDFCYDGSSGKIVSIARNYDFPDFHVVAESIDQLLEFVYIYSSYSWNMVYSVDLISDMELRVANLIKAGFAKRWIELLNDRN